MVEERHQPGDRNEAEKRWCGDPEDEALSFPGAIRSAICYRIATLLHEVKLSEGKPEKHQDERDEDRPVWLQGGKIAPPIPRLKSRSGPTQQADAPILASIPPTSAVFALSGDRISWQPFSASLPSPYHGTESTGKDVSDEMALAYWQGAVA